MNSKASRFVSGKKRFSPWGFWNTRGEESKCTDWRAERSHWGWQQKQAAAGTSSHFHSHKLLVEYAAQLKHKNKIKNKKKEKMQKNILIKMICELRKILY